MGAALEGTLCEIPRSGLFLKTWRWKRCPVALCLRDWNGSTVAAGTAETVDGVDVTRLGRGMGRNGSALEWMLRSKNSAKESCVEASLNVTLRGGNLGRGILKKEWVWAVLSACKHPETGRTSVWKH